MSPQPEPDFPEIDFSDDGPEEFRAQALASHAQLPPTADAPPPPPPPAKQ